MTGINTYALHPGVITTELSRYLDFTLFKGARWLFNFFGRFFMKNPEQGAQTTIYCTVSEEAANQTGLYYE